MYKKTTYVLLTIFLITSCSSFDSVKRGITGAKQKSTDEFLVQKKDPLILPPDYENLPSPDEKAEALEEISIFENTLEGSSEDNTAISNTTEGSILKRIQSK